MRNKFDLIDEFRRGFGNVSNSGNAGA